MNAQVNPDVYFVDFPANPAYAFVIGAAPVEQYTAPIGPEPLSVDYTGASSQVLNHRSPHMFIVIESTPGYLPDADDPALFGDYSDAVAYVNELCDELEADGYTVDRSHASADNLYAAHATRNDTVAPDLGRTVQIIRDDT